MINTVVSTYVSYLDHRDSLLVEIPIRISFDMLVSDSSEDHAFCLDFRQCVP